MRFYGLTAASAVVALGRVQWENLESQLSKEERVYQRIQSFMVTNGIPGVSVAVSINGKTVLASGYGFADVENGFPCTRETLMRIASISKPITASIAGKLVETGKLKWDESVYHYIPEFPKKKFENKEVDITIRQLLSHTGGIRHYKKIYEGFELQKWDNLYKNYGANEKDVEFLYRNVYKIELFKNDDLIAKPGTKFDYTTHGFTLLALCLEKAAGEEFGKLAMKIFNELEMRNSKLDKNEALVANRAKFYRRNIRHVLVNVPEVDCSYKYASGGILSNVDDLLKFANAMLKSYQSEDSSIQNFLKRSTAQELWDKTVEYSKDYALGWFQWPVDCIDNSNVKNRIWYHTGAAVGASSILLVKSDLNPQIDNTNPQGICVAILVNLQDVDTRGLALEIVDIFENK